MKNKTLILLAALMALVTFAACDKPVNSINVNADLIPGKWHDTETPTEFWRFDIGGSGETWDTSEDVQEGEGTNFNWSVLLDQLRIDLYGRMGQHVYYDYTVTYQSADTLTFKDIYDNPRTFVKI
ncbi:MAG: hypothetical protein IJ785_00075 [Bacteroidales bacterium]|nr:hypothetical protein [Bacteroidales bacterium]